MKNYKNTQIKLNIILVVIFSILMLLLMTSCESKSIPNTESNGVEVVSYDGCEYIVIGYENELLAKVSNRLPILDGVLIKGIVEKQPIKYSINGMLEDIENEKIKN